MVEMLQAIGAVLAYLAVFGAIVLLGLMRALGDVAMSGTLWVVMAGLTLGYFAYRVRH